jgi:hypothetical protein
MRPPVWKKGRRKKEEGRRKPSSFLLHPCSWSSLAAFSLYTVRDSGNAPARIVRGLGTPGTVL